MAYEELKTFIIDEIYLGDEPNWIKTRKRNEDLLDHTAAITIELDPPDAKTIEEVKSFKLKQTVLGYITYDFERSK